MGAAVAHVTRGVWGREAGSDPADVRHGRVGGAGGGTARAVALAWAGSGGGSGFGGGSGAAASGGAGGERHQRRLYRDAGERLFDHLAWRRDRSSPPRGFAISSAGGRGASAARRWDRAGNGACRWRRPAWVAGVLEDLGALDAAPDGAGIERALDPGVGVLLADDDRLGELLMGVAPAIDGADADLEMLGELFVGGAEAAHVPRLLGKFWFVDHGAVDSAGGVGVESRVAVGKMSVGF